MDKIHPNGILSLWPCLSQEVASGRTPCTFGWQATRVMKNRSPFAVHIVATN